MGFALGAPQVYMSGPQIASLFLQKSAIFLIFCQKRGDLVAF
jgi:hypothetical protein